MSQRPVRPSGGQTGYGGWLVRSVFGLRAAADPRALKRAIHLFSASAARILNEPERALIARRIGELPDLKKIVYSDDEIKSALNVKFDRVRVVGSLTFAVQEYYNVAKGVDEGEARTIRDRAGILYDVRVVCLREPPATGIGFFIGARLIAFDGDWRRLLVSAGPDDIAAVVRDHRQALELSPAEADGLAARLLPLAPQNRVEEIDRLIERSPAAYILRLRDSLAEGVSASELIPIDPEPLAGYVGLDGDGLRPEIDPEQMAEKLCGRTSWLTVLLRFMGAPVRLPETLVARFRALPRHEGRDLLKRLLRMAPTPVSAMHTVRLAHLVLDGKTARRLLRISLFRLLNELRRDEFQAYVHVVRWVGDELYRRPISRDWSPAKREFACWVLAHDLIRLLRSAGHSMVGISSMLHGSADGREEALLGDRETAVAIYNSHNVAPRELLVCGIADALVDWPEGSLDETSRATLARNLRTGNPEFPWMPDVYYGTLVANDSMGSYFSGNRAGRLRKLLGSEVEAHEYDTFTPEYLSAAVERAVAGDHNAWAYLASMTLGVESLGESVTRPLLDECKQGSPQLVLLPENDLSWRLRLNVLARLAGTLGTTAEVDSAWMMWRSALSAMGRLECATVENAAAMVQAAAMLGRSVNGYGDRAASLSKALLEMANGPRGECVLSAGILARRLRNRLSGNLIPEDLSRAILVSGFRE
jgi:hypothetical protein